MASNPRKGEVEFTLGEKSYTLLFSINALCVLEERMGGGSFVELANAMRDPDKVGLSTLRTLFWSGLYERHEELTEKEAGQLMHDLGLVEASNLVMKAFTLSFPEVKAPGPLPQAGKKRAVSTGKSH
jgi:hypothetical protein